MTHLHFEIFEIQDSASSLQILGFSHQRLASVPLCLAFQRQQQPHVRASEMQLWCLKPSTVV